MDHYKNLLTEERFAQDNTKYANTYSHEGKEINVGIKDVERTIRSLKKSKICGSEGICVEFLKMELKNYTKC